MAKVTTKLQVTIPKAIADRLGIEPGDELEFRTAGRALWVVPTRRRGPVLSRDQRLAAFDRATARIESWAASRPLPTGASDRGWSREELYEERYRRGRDG